MIYGVVGRTGAGKSYFALRRIVQWLRDRPRDHVVTNLALDVPKLCAHLLQEYGDTFNAADRIEILELEEIAQFFRHYGEGYEIAPERTVVIGEPDGRTLRHLDYSPRERAGHSCLFVLDESDEIFDAKGFASMGRDLKMYIRHQRKFGDDVYFLTPQWSFLVKEVRVLCHCVWVLENGQQLKLGKIPLIGSKFKGLPWITGTQWKVKENGGFGGAGEAPRDTERFRIEKDGLADCYRTEDGLGVRGITQTVRSAEKSKGWSLWWLALPAAGLIYVAANFDTWLGGLIGGVGKTANAASRSAATGGPVRAVVSAAIQPAAASAVPVPAETPAEVYWVGKAPAAHRGVLIIFLSDGRQFTTQSKEFEGFGWQTVKIAGKEYRPPPPGFGLR